LALLVQLDLQVPRVQEQRDLQVPLVQVQQAQVDYKDLQEPLD
jgi:hypothetical protein